MDNGFHEWMQKAVDSGIDGEDPFELSQAAWEHQEKRVRELEELLTDREERLQKIYSWAEAYPLDIFPDATPEEVASIEPNLRARVHAKWARHIFSRLMKYSDTGQRP